MNPIDTLIRAAGNQRALAQQMGVTQPRISQWRQQGYLPALRAAEAEALYGIPRSQLVKPRLRDLVGADDDDGELT